MARRKPNPADEEVVFKALATTYATAKPDSPEAEVSVNVLRLAGEVQAETTDPVERVKLLLEAMDDIGFGELAEERARVARRRALATRTARSHS